MKYLCLIYQDQNKLDALSASDYDALVAETTAYTAEICQRGYCANEDALEPVLSATTIRLRADRLSITDGAFIETAEQLASYITIEARDLNEAIRIASKMPLARMGGIEIRPIKHAVIERDNRRANPNDEGATPCTESMQPCR